MAVTPESNLALIEELQELVGAKTYEPVDGPEFSYPAVGQAVDDEMWKFVTLALGSGVLDQGGRPYWLRKLASDSETNSANQMRLTVSTTTDNAQAVLNGFYHRLLRDMRLDFPMPLSETTYYVVLELNPLKARSPEGPISVKVYPNELNTESGRQHLVLWTVTRKPNQLLTEARVETVRPKISPHIAVDNVAALPDPSTVLWGTQAFVASGNEVYRAFGSSEETGGPTSWRPVTTPPWVDSKSNEYVKPSGHGQNPQFRVVGDRVELRGRVTRNSGSTFYTNNDYRLIPNLPIPEVSGKFVSGWSRNEEPFIIDAVAGATPKFNVFTSGASWLDMTGFYYYLR